MTRCWKFNPSERPSFTCIVNEVEKFLTELKGYFEMADEGVDSMDKQLPSNPTAIIKDESSEGEGSQENVRTVILFNV